MTKLDIRTFEDFDPQHLFILFNCIASIQGKDLWNLLRKVSTEIPLSKATFYRKCQELIEDGYLDVEEELHGRLTAKYYKTTTTFFNLFLRSRETCLRDMSHVHVSLSVKIMAALSSQCHEDARHISRNIIYLQNRLSSQCHYRGLLYSVYSVLLSKNKNLEGIVQEHLLRSTNSISVGGTGGVGCSDATASPLPSNPPKAAFSSQNIQGDWATELMKKKGLLPTEKTVTGFVGVPQLAKHLPLSEKVESETYCHEWTNDIVR